MGTPRFFATKDDANVPTVYDWQNISAGGIAFPGSSMWVARRYADHLNGKHDRRRNQKCELCSA